MKKNNPVLMSIILLALLVSFSITGFTKAPDSKINIQPQLTSIDNATYIDANKILMFVTNHGNFGRDMSSVFGYDYGTWYPYSGNSDDILNNVNGAGNKSPLYAAGIWVGGKVGNDVRVAISEYGSEYVPGPMLNATFQPDSPDFKVYKLYADSLASNPNEDYNNWPVVQGAPIDEQGRPLMRGDQMLWTVYNDAGQHNEMLTDPLGIEIQQTVWAQDEDGTDTIPAPTEYYVTQLAQSNLTVKVNIIDVDSLKGHEYSVVYTYDSLNTRHWDLYNLTLGTTVLEGMTNFNGTFVDVPADGITVSVDDPNKAKEWIYESANPPNVSPVAIDEDPSYTGRRWFTGGSHGGDLFFGGVFLEPNFWGETSVGYEEMPTVEIRFRPMQSYTDLNFDGTYTIGEPFVVDDITKTQKAFMYSSYEDASYIGFYDVPFTAWDISDSLNPRQLNVVLRDRDQNHAWNLHIVHDPLITDTAGLPNGGDLRFNYTMISNSDYDPTGTYFGDGTGGTIGWWNTFDGTWTLWLDDRNSGGTLAEECILTLVPGEVDQLPDTFTFQTTPHIPTTTGGDGVSIYMMYKLFNKGGNQIDSCYFSLWSDPDLGDLSDDLVGCDTLSDLFFCYNQSNNDAQYGNLPPAIGFKIIHGPLVSANGNTAMFDESEVANYKNSNMSSFNKYRNGTDPDNAQEVFEYMQGRDAKNSGSPYVYDGDTINYVHSGDPVTGIGDLDISPSDRRMMASFGPFEFTPGDSQYVLVKMTVGQGTDRLNSITRMKDILNAPYRIQTDIDDNTEIGLPTNFSLAQNYPNPFNPTTQIKFTLPVRSDVTLEIFNVLGQQVTTLIDNNLSAGSHSIDWDASEVSTGVYFYKLTAGEFVLSKKMMLLK